MYSVTKLAALGVKLPKALSDALEAYNEATAPEDPPAIPAAGPRSSDKEILAHIAATKRFELWQSYQTNYGQTAQRRAAETFHAAQGDLWSETADAISVELNTRIADPAWGPAFEDEFNYLMGALRDCVGIAVSRADTPVVDVVVHPYSKAQGIVHRAQQRGIRLADLHGPRLWFADAPEGLAVGLPPSFNDCRAAGSLIDVSGIPERIEAFATAKALEVTARLQKFETIHWNGYDLAAGLIDAASRGNHVWAK
jgi:hypothetical protein